jgi:hypothetical protein
VIDVIVQRPERHENVRHSCVVTACPPRRRLFAPRPCDLASSRKCDQLQRPRPRPLPVSSPPRRNRAASPARWPDADHMNGLLTMCNVLIFMRRARRQSPSRSGGRHALYLSVRSRSEVPMEHTISDRPQQGPNGWVTRRLAVQLLPACAIALLVAGCEATTGETTRPRRDGERQNDSMDRNGNGGGY